MRKLFGTDGVRGMANRYPITPEVAMKLGKAAAEVFKTDKEEHLILIGKDTRRSGYMLENALTAGICSMGVNVLLVGPMPTPAIAHLTRSFAADAGVMISASHNPAGDNGIKFFSRDGAKLPDETEERIEKLFFSEEIPNAHIVEGAVGRAKRIDDARGRYIEFAKASNSNQSLKGIHMVLDCANGAAYCVSPFIFRELGAEVDIINDSPNGLNVNLNCGSEHPEMMRQTVLHHHADVGVAVDGDADRVVMVDEHGEFVDGDMLMALMAPHWKRQGRLKHDTVVATEMSNGGLAKALEREGIRLLRTRVGDRYVYDEMVRGDFNLGGEQSGHIIVRDYCTTGDGTVVALQVITQMKQTGKKLSDMARVMTRLPQVLLNVEVDEKIPFEELPELRKKIEEADRQLKGSGRVNVRYSGTQNLLRIMLEGPSEEFVRKQADAIAVEAKRSLQAGVKK
ncbi:MAG: phosphoglucosamine mutase [Acidobacteriia bacterium]|nr:phosphoglucosamine mutase [Terriglobia bacterium]